MAARHDVCVGDVALDGEGAVAGLGRGAFEALLAAGEQRTWLPRWAEADADAAPEAARGADDDDPRCASAVSHRPAPCPSPAGRSAAPSFQLGMPSSSWAIGYSPRGPRPSGEWLSSWSVKQALSAL